MEVQDSNPYNVLIEACNTLGYNMIINYNDYTISFIDKNKIGFSGYRYRLDSNANNISIDYSGEEMTSLLRVSGGTDIYDSIISLTPSIPIAIENYIIENYVDKNGNDWI